MDQNNQFNGHNSHNGPNAWQTNAYNSQFQNNMNPEDFAAGSPFGGNSMPQFMAGFFPPQNGMQYNPAGNGNGDSYMQGSNFQPEVGLFNGNGSSFAQNENVNPNPPVSFVQNQSWN